MIYIASDHAGFATKEKIKAFLESANLEPKDLGPNEFIKGDDYPIYSFKLGEAVVKDNVKGIIVCDTGAGVSIAVNKVKGIRGARVESKQEAIRAREHNDANVLILDAITFDPEKDFEIIELFLNTPFSEEERHIRRIEEINDYEQNR